MRTIKYQQDVLGDITAYMGDLEATQSLPAAWSRFWTRQDIHVGLNGVDPYKNTVPGVPYVCMKVPTGGGKTYIACSALKRIFDKLPAGQPRFVVWLVPSDAILTQTYAALNDAAHEYRRKLDLDFSGRVQIYSKDQLLNGQNFTPDNVMNQLSVCVFSYASFRINSTSADARKVNQENGNLKLWADYFKDKRLLLADTPETALIQVLRQLTPLVVVDESHNAGSKLSVEMLQRLNPSFIMALTATPLKGANILSYVDARELKRENMVKLPVVVYNRNDISTVIRDAVQLRRSLEKAAEAEREHTGRYIRPIVLFQAQPNIKGKENDTYNRVRQMLLDAGIPAEEIAIKTSQLDEIGKTNLLSEQCPIRFIITVNALKEGWDCPFAYILASLANKTSRVDVEQILGRVLRQPYQTKLGVPLLNNAYVLTCSNDFRQVLDNIVVGLNRAGFSRRDYAIGGEDAPAPAPVVDTGTQVTVDDVTPDDDHDDFEDVNTEQLKQSLTGGEGSAEAQNALDAMLAAARTKAEQYDQAARQDDHGHEGGEKGAMKNQIEVDPRFRDEILSLRLPQFCYMTAPNLFGDGHVMLEREHLSEGFTLTGADAHVNFDLSTGDMYNVDLKESGEAVPQYIKAGLNQIQA
ncbi:MAG: DEAD/DEAH box helicase, partial [bacterium]